MSAIKRTPAEGEEYCPVCGRIIVGEQMEDGSYLFVHDDIIHSEDDLSALFVGVQ